jgi:hypothetical protein
VLDGGAFLSFHCKWLDLAISSALLAAPTALLIGASPRPRLLDDRSPGLHREHVRALIVRGAEPTGRTAVASPVASMTTSFSVLKARTNRSSPEPVIFTRPPGGPARFPDTTSAKSAMDARSDHPLHLLLLSPVLRRDQGDTNALPAQSRRSQGRPAFSIVT